MPNPTPYDLNFRLLGIPVRVSPWFWVAMAIVGYNAETPKFTVVFVTCAFVSILIHEFGHGLMARAFGFHPEIALYQMGGLCASEGGRQTPGQRLAVLAWGPGAQFVLLALLVAAGPALFGVSWVGSLALMKFFLGLRLDANFLQALLEFHFHHELQPIKGEIYWDLLQINLLWPLLNLLPIWPLDGGQITGILLTSADRRGGMRKAHIAGLVTAGLLAVYRFQQGSQRSAVFFALFALINFQMLQAIRERERFGLDRGDDDWWRG